MYQIIPLHSRDNLKKSSIKINVATDEGNSRNEIGHGTDDEIYIYKIREKYDKIIQTHIT